MTRPHTTAHNGHHPKPKMMAHAGKRPNGKARKLRAQPVVEIPKTIDDAIDQEMRRMMIETAAYFLAETRQFAPGYELEDWCAAERAIDEKLNATVCWLDESP